MLGFSGLPPRVRGYVLVVSFAFAAQCIHFWLAPTPPAVPADQVLLVLVITSALALFSELKPMLSPSGEKRTVAASVFMAAVLIVGPGLAMVPVTISQVGYHLAQRQPFPKLLFNWAQFGLAVGFSGLAYLGVLRLLGLPADLHFSSPLAGIALLALLATYYFVNSILVAVVIAMSQNRPVVEQYRDTNLAVVIEFAAEAVVGVIAAMLWHSVPWAVGIIALVVLSIYRAYSLATDLQTAQRALYARMGEVAHRTDELTRRTNELGLLNQVSEALTRALDLSELWEMLAEQIGHILDTPCFFIALYDEQQAQIQIAFGQDEGTRVAGQVIPAHAGLSGWIVTNAQPLLVRDLAVEGHRFSPTITWGSGKQPVSILAVPMILGGRVSGVICAQAYRPNAYTEDDLRLLSAIAGQAAVAVNSARLRREAADAQALKHLDVLKTQFISTVSHELRTPLTPIIGYAEMLTMEPYPEAEVLEMATEIHRSGLHMQGLVDDLLDFSRIESGRLTLAFQSIDLEGLIVEAVRDFAGTSARHELRAEVVAPLPLVEADPSRIRQVLHNLLSNAVKYSPDGGLVVARAIAFGDEVRVSVGDQGIGMPADKMSRLFEVFYRVDSEVTRRVRGTGLGLAISKHIVESHGGRIWAESELDRGSVFSFSLPLGARSLQPALPGLNGHGEEP